MQWCTPSRNQAGSSNALSQRNCASSRPIRTLIALPRHPAFRLLQAFLKPEFAFLSNSPDRCIEGLRSPASSPESLDAGLATIRRDDGVSVEFVPFETEPGFHALPTGRKISALPT